MKEKIYSLLRDSDFRKYFANTSWLMADKILRLVLGLFVWVYVARYLGPDRYGLLQYAMSFVALFGAFSRLGLENIVVRNAVQEPEKQNELLGSAFGLRVIGGLFLLLIVFITIKVIEDNYLTILLVMVIASGNLLQAVEVFEYYFRAIVEAKYISYAYITGFVISSVIKLILIWKSASILPFAIVFVIEWIVNGLFLYFFYKRYRNSKKRWKFNFKQSIKLLHDSWPLVLSGLVIMIYMRIDQVMIKNLLDVNAVGQYAVAVKLSETWYFIPIVISNSVFPAIINLKKSNSNNYYNSLQSLYDFMIWFSIFSSVFILLFSKFIIISLFGNEYLDAIGVLKIYIWSGVFVSFGSVWSKWVINEGYSETILKMNILSMLTNVVLNLFFINILGVNGAALATLISYSLGHTIFALLFKEQKIAIKMFFRAFNLFRILK